VLLRCYKIPGIPEIHQIVFRRSWERCGDVRKKGMEEQRRQQRIQKKCNARMHRRSMPVHHDRFLSSAIAVAQTAGAIRNLTDSLP